MIDNHVYWGNALQTDIQRIVWRRVLDMNDRALRQITTSLGGGGDGVPREAGFDITVAFEVMAILCLARNLGVLQQRLGYIIVATRCDKTPLLARDLKADEAMTMLLRDAMQPHVVQTLAFVHGGRFANIAHGCNPVTATATALKLADYVVTEAGFGADLGAEKFMNIKCRKAGLSPACVVVVATCGTTAMLCRHWAEGSAGITDLARRVVELADSGAVAVIPLYPDDMGLAEKFDTVARRIYRADRAVMDARVCMQLVEWEAQGFGDLPVCMVKTPYSSTTDPDVRGAPTVCDVPVREVRLSAGAGFVVAILIGADPASEVYVRS